MLLFLAHRDIVYFVITWLSQ